MAQESKTSDNDPWTELQKSTKITFETLMNEIQTTDKSAALTVGKFHDEAQIQKQTGIFSWFSTTVDTKKNEMMRDPLYQYTILNSNKLTPSIKQAWVHQTTSFSPAIDRAVGCMAGMGIGDAVGHPLEFVPIDWIEKPLAERPRFSYKDQQWYNECNKFKLQRGQWTDDASMGLCIADSFILCDAYKGSDIRIRFWNWWQNGYNNAFKLDKDRHFKASVGLGGNISSSIYSCKHGVVPTERYQVDHDKEDSGNGSLMRLAAVPIYFHNNLQNAMNNAFESSFTTHPGYIAAEACSLLANIVVSAIHPKENNIDFEPRSNVKQFMEVVTTKYGEMLMQQRENMKSKMDTMEVKDEEKGDLNEEYKLLLRQYNAKELVLRLINSAEVENKEICWNWKSNLGELPILDCFYRRCGTRDRTKCRDKYNGYPVSPGYWGSYCMDGLSMAMHCVYHSECFADAIEKCVNMLG
eukprot:35117_1